MANQETEIVKMEQAFCELSLSRKPAEVIEEARQAAVALKAVIDGKKDKVMFNGETYLENDDWILCGRFFGVTARIVSDNYVEYGAVKGFEATAEAFLVSEGKVIGRANAMCLNDEENWGQRPKYEWVKELDKDGKEIWLKSKEGKPYPKGNRKLTGYVPVPLFQLRSMSQTRAISKVLSTIFKWVVVLAGYKPTPAEEVDQTTADASYERTENEKPEIKKPQRKAKPADIEGKAETSTTEAKKEEAPRDPECVSEAQERMLWAVSNKAKLSRDEVHEKLKKEFQDKAGNPLEHLRDMRKSDCNVYLQSIQSLIA